MRFEFSYQFSNLFIAIVGVLLVFYIISRFLAKKRVITFGNYEILEKVVGRKILSPDIIPMILRILAVLLIVIAVSNPRLTYIKFSPNTEYVIAMDTSASMLTPDFYPNRLEVEKKAVLNFIDKAEDAEIGIISFSGKAYVKSQLTNDRDKLKEIVLDLNVETPAGTAIGEALISSVSLLSNGVEGKNKTIILITDGRNNVGISIEKALSVVKQNNIKVFCLGIGSNKTMNYTIPEEIKKLNATVAEFPILDENSLIKIANETGGKFFKITNETEFEKAIEFPIVKKEITINPTMYLLFAAIVILLIEWALEMTKFRVIP